MTTRVTRIVNIYRNDCERERVRKGDAASTIFAVGVNQKTVKQPGHSMSREPLIVP